MSSEALREFLAVAQGGKSVSDTGDEGSSPSTAADAASEAVIRAFEVGDGGSSPPAATKTQRFVRRTCLSTLPYTIPVAILAHADLSTLRAERQRDTEKSSP